VIESDDFNSNSLDSRWTFVNPLNDGSFNLIGAGTGDAYLELFVPGGTTHNIWKTAKNAVRVMQPAANTDFEVEVKFGSEPLQPLQMQGILVEQDENNWLRFDIFYDDGTLNVFAGSTINGNSRQKIRVGVAAGSASYLRVNREGDVWSLDYSADGVNWTTAGNFTQALAVNSTGTFVGNSGPAFTSQVDYFFNTAAPIVPEDGSGGGSSNQPPIANDDSAATEVNTPVTIDVLANDSDSENGLLSINSFEATSTEGGSISLDDGGTPSNSADDQLIYTPPDNLSGSDSFSYTIADDQGAISAAATVNITLNNGSGDSNQPPIANDDTAMTEINTPVIIDVLANDSDLDGNIDSSSLDIASNPSNGNLNLDTLTGAVTYTPNLDFTGNDSFRYTVADERDAISNPATVNITVNELSTTGGPNIDVWYGSNQTFGQIGQPQNWVNILGNVSDPNGVASLTYSLNGGSEIPLTIGKDGGRLDDPGDFNVDIAYTDLDGSSIDDLLTLKAIDQAGNISTETVTIDYEAGSIWPEEYSIDWSSVNDIQDVAQVIDGKWAIEGDTVRTVEPGYDRLLGIGDIAWQDYEIEVPITLNGAAGRGNAVGFLMRWQGHTDNPEPGKQPKAGFLPLGAIGWYQGNTLVIQGDNNNTKDDSGKTLQEGSTYNFKMRVETLDTGSLYSLKVWELGTSEPVEWDVQRNEGLSDLSSGSVALVAHRYDASFGDVTITSI
jgi:regulation of enolase protein 1 (concanavalin A-like superfamily)